MSQSNPANIHHLIFWKIINEAYSLVTALERVSALSHNRLEFLLLQSQASLAPSVKKY